MGLQGLVTSQNRPPKDWLTTKMILKRNSHALLVQMVQSLRKAIRMQIVVLRRIRIIIMELLLLLSVRTNLLMAGTYTSPSTT